MTPRTHRFVALGLLSLLVVSGCSSAGSDGQTSAPDTASTAEPTSSASGVSPSASGSELVPSESPAQETETSSEPTSSNGSELRDRAAGLVARMSVQEQAASLVMAGVPATGASSAEIAALQKQGISNVFLRGRSSLSVAQTADKVEDITDKLEKNLPEKLPVWVATDQEGGFVRVLQGPGFTQLPTALTQGTWSQEKLESQITQVGDELADAGINVNLAPVADVVPTSIGTDNAPIGYFGRQYADNAQQVSDAVSTVNQALEAKGIQPVVKHFPGLGRVSANTDTSSSVTDTVTGVDSPDLEPFKQSISQEIAWVMISNARYTRIDAKTDAPFSDKVITGLLREQLGYEGLVISDDLCDAKQVSHLAVGQRAIRFVAAGGTMPLCVSTPDAITMAAALAKEAANNQEFSAQVQQAAILVLEEKLRGA